MVVECIAIILMILIMTFVFLRIHKKNYALAVLPLTIVPFLHLVAYNLQALAASWFGILPQIFISAADVCGLALSSILLGLFASRILSKKTRTTYLTLSGLFSVVLVCILIANTLP